MSVPGMLFKILEDLIDDDLKTFQWFLTLKPPVLDNCKRIAKSQVVNLSREDTVSRIIESYGEASAVNLTIEILRKMNMNDAAEKLKKTYAGAVNDESLQLTCLVSFLSLFTCVFIDSLHLYIFICRRKYSCNSNLPFLVVMPCLISVCYQMSNVDKFKWYLNMSIVDGCKPIPTSKLEEANQQRTVNVMIESYREAPAVNLTVEILRKMNMNNAAEELQKTYAGDEFFKLSESPKSVSFLSLFTSSMCQCPIPKMS
uniref:Pyrin domain-containing protein n=1 Tax=Anabas testudineus TaxID=64144 RepID=A0A3Q1HAW3_ANATE